MSARPLVVLVCGSRGWAAVRPASAGTPIREWVDSLAPNTILINGGATGVDTIAATMARHRGLHVATVPALWNAHGRKAGPIRNQAMLSLLPNRVVAFRATGSSPGTDDMVARARAAGVPVDLYIDGLGWQS